MGFDQVFKEKGSFPGEVTGCFSKLSCEVTEHSLSQSTSSPFILRKKIQMGSWWPRLDFPTFTKLDVAM